MKPSLEGISLSLLQFDFFLLFLQFIVSFPGFVFPSYVNNNGMRSQVNKVSE